MVIKIFITYFSKKKFTLTTAIGLGKHQDVHALTANHTEILDIICLWQNSENNSRRIHGNQGATVSYLVRTDS